MGVAVNSERWSLVASPIFTGDFDVATEPLPGVNEAFLREVMAYIELHQDQWNQASWANVNNACGTAYCLAGWAYILGTGKDALGVRGSVVARTAATLLGLDDLRASHIFHFTQVLDGSLVRTRPPTFPELCARVEQVTGVRFKPAPEVLV